MLVLTLAHKQSDFGSDDGESASIWTTSTMEDMPVTRLYQSALLLAGFIATFQTMGIIQTFGIFQASHLAEPCQQLLMKFNF
jgi:hypothetical protein